MRPFSTPRPFSGFLVGLATLCAFALAPSASAQTDLLLSGVVDGPLGGGLPKAVEIYVVNDVADLSMYAVGSANNGGGTDGAEFVLSGSATAGSFLYVAAPGSGSNDGVVRFNEFFGFNPDFADDAANINGDDAIELFYDASGAFAGSEMVVDVFGDINTDGTGEAWDHVDGWAYRMDGTGPDGSTFVPGNFAYSGPDALDGETSNGTAATPFPIGTYTGGAMSTGDLIVTTAADELNEDGDCSLREAVQAANTDTVVDMCDGTSGETITFASAYTIALSMGEMLVTDGVLIDASSVGNVTVDAAGSSRIFDVDAPGQMVDFASLTLMNGNSGAGGSSAPDAGGAVDLKSGSQSTFTDVNVTGSVAGINGGGIHGAGNTTIVITTTSEGTSLISDNEAQGNDAGMGGGGVWGAGTTLISGNVTIDGNAATGTSGSGGGVFNFGGTLSITGATVSNNTANRAGGGVEDFGDNDDATDVTLTDVTLSGNSIMTPAPGNGGGLHTGGGDVIVTGGLVTGNSAVEGAGLWSSGSLTVSGTTIQNNEAVGDADAAFEGGGGLFNQGGVMLVSNAVITGNSATGPGGSGGGAFNNGGSLTVDASSFSGNTSLRAGGGLEVNGGTVELTNTDFTENTTGATPGNGGALHVTMGDVTATGGTVSGNMAASEGGGFWNNAGWTMTVDGTVFSSNTASGAAADNGGGGLFNNGGTLVVKNATVSGNSADGSSGSGGGLLSTDGAVTISSTTFNENSAPRAGGGIEMIDGSLGLTEVDFTANMTGSAPGNGGALHVTGSAAVTSTDGMVSGNMAAREGGGFWNQAGATMTVNGTSFTGNTASGDAADDGGGGLFNNGGELIVNNATIVENVADGTAGSGGGILNLGGMLTVNGGTIQANAANRAGGGVEDAAGTVVLDGVVIDQNIIAVASPGNGGGLHSGGGVVTVRGGRVTSNTAVEGGGLWSNGTLTVEPDGEGMPTTLWNNTATGDDATHGGGGLFAEVGADVTLVGTFIDGNMATGTSGSGGGIFVADNASVRMTGGRIAENRANRAGGGVEVADDGETTEVAGYAELVEVMVTDNTIAEANPGNGGGLHIGGAARTLVQRSTFANNAAREGGGLWVSGGGTLEMANSTVSGNAATEDGGGLYRVDGGTVRLDALTVADNTAGGAGGGFGQGGTPSGVFEFNNTILADNAASSGPNCFGSYQATFSLIEDTADCTLSGSDNLAGQDPMLAALADNGGPTQTRAISATSPAVDAGQTALAVDQRGFTRSVGQDDIGAYEFGAADDGGQTLACSMAVPLSFGDFDTDGNDADYGEFAEVLNGAGSDVDLSSCSFATFDPQTERVVYTAQTTGTVAASESYFLASVNGDQAIPTGSIPDGPGALVLLEGTTTVGATVEDVLGDVVAAVVYRAEDDVFASMSGGGAASQREEQREAIRVALARLGQPVADEDGAETIDLDVAAAPNPFRERATVSFGVAEATDVRVAVYDALGREVALLAEAPYSTGRHDVTFEAGRLPAGVYVIRATVGTEARMTRVTIAR